MGYAIAIIGTALVLGGFTYIRHPKGLFANQASQRHVIEIETPDSNRYSVFGLSVEDMQYSGTYPETPDVGPASQAGVPAVQGAYTGLPLEPIRGWQSRP